MVRAAAWSVIRQLLCQHSPQRTRPRPIEQLESRTLLTVTVNGTSSADTISVSWNGSNIVTVVNGSSSSHGEDGVTVNGLGGNDTINLISMPNWPLGVNGGDGNDTITFGGGDFDAHFSEFTFVDGDAGTDTVVIDDTTDLGLDEYDLSFDSFFAGGSDFTKTNASVGLYMDPTNENFVLKCNHASNDIIVNDRNSMGLNSIAVQGLDGDDTCEYTNVDTTDAFSFDGGIGANTLKYAQSSFVSTSFTFTFNALDFGPNNLTWLNTQTAQITGTTAADTFNINVLGTATSLEVIGDLGNDTYNVGNGDIAGNIFGPLRITDFNSQGEGIDKVFYNDSLDTGDDTYDEERHRQLQQDRPEPPDRRLRRELHDDRQQRQRHDHRDPGRLHQLRLHRARRRGRRRHHLRRRQHPRFAGQRHAHRRDRQRLAHDRRQRRRADRRHRQGLHVRPREHSLRREWRPRLRHHREQHRDGFARRRAAEQHV